MRGFKLVIIMAGAIVLWLLAVAFGPQIVKREAVAWDWGLGALAAAFAFWVSDLYLYKYTHRIMWPGFSSTLRSDRAIASLEVTLIPEGKDKTTKVYRFLMFALGGSHYIPKSGGGDKGVAFIREDLLMKDKRDPVNVYVRSIPDLYRNNNILKRFEKPLEALPKPFLEKMDEFGWLKRSVPVWVAYDPLKEPANLSDADKAIFDYKTAYHDANTRANRMSDIVNDFGDTSTTIAKTAKLASRNMGEKKEKKRPILEQEGDEDER